MLTDFGKRTRKLRIDNDERLKDMADKVGVSPAFLSAVELGSKVPPDSLPRKIILAYKLKGNEAEELRTAAVRSRSEFHITAKSAAARETADVFARSVNKLPPDILEQLRKLMEG